MKRIVSLVGTLFVALCLSLVAGQAMAAGKGKKAKKIAKLPSIKGEVVKKATKKGKLLGLELRADDGKIYKVVLNPKGKMLARKLHGKKAEVQARVIRKGTRKKPVLWLKVKRFKEVKEVKKEPASDADEEAADGSAAEDE
jgi:hypothetical protein